MSKSCSDRGAMIRKKRKTSGNKAAVTVIILLALVGATTLGFLTGFFGDMYDKLFLDAPSRSDVSYPVWAVCVAYEKNDVAYIKKAAPEANESNKEYVKKHIESLEAKIDAVGSGVTTSYRIIEAEEMTEDELESCKNRYDNVTEGKKLKVELTLRSDGEKSTRTETLSVIKQDGSWKLAF